MYLDIDGVLNPGCVYAVDVHPPVHSYSIPAAVRRHSYELGYPLNYSVLLIFSFSG